MTVVLHLQVNSATWNELGRLVRKSNPDNYFQHTSLSLPDRHSWSAECSSLVSLEEPHSVEVQENSRDSSLLCTRQRNWNKNIMDAYLFSVIP